MSHSTIEEIVADFQLFRVAFRSVRHATGSRCGTGRGVRDGTARDGCAVRHETGRRVRVGLARDRTGCQAVRNGTECARRHGTGWVCGTARNGTACVGRYAAGRYGMLWSTRDHHGAARDGVSGTARDEVWDGTARDGCALRNGTGRRVGVGPARDHSFRFLRRVELSRSFKFCSRVAWVLGGNSIPNQSPPHIAF